MKNKYPDALIMSGTHDENGKFTFGSFKEDKELIRKIVGTYAVTPKQFEKLAEAVVVEGRRRICVRAITVPYVKAKEPYGFGDTLYILSPKEAKQ